MRTVALLLLAAITLVLSSGATRPQAKHYTMPNAAFFFANNDDYYEAFSAVAVSMCIQDKAQDTTPEAWRQAAKACRDSKTDEDGDPLINDGQWRKFVYPAIDVITQMCRENAAKLCESFK